MRTPVESSSRGGPYPAAAAIGFIAAMTAAIWLQSRTEPVAPRASIPVAAAPQPHPEPAARPMRPAVVAFLAFAEAEAPEELPLDHAYTSEGLRRLSAAIAARGDSLLWRDRAKRLEAAATRLEKDPSSLDHADAAREAFTLAAEWIAELPRASGAVSAPAGGAQDRLAAAAEAIDPEVPLREQKGQVERFFDLAAATLAPPKAGEQRT